MTITIILADDHEIFRQGLQMLLASQPDFELVGQAANGPAALALAKRLQPDVAIIDILMPGMNGLEVAEQICRSLPKTRVIILSMHSHESYVTQALSTGAAGYILKSSSATDLIQAVRAVTAGQRYLSPQLTEQAINAYIEQSRSASKRPSTLTMREYEVLQWSVQGLTSQQIADRLSISFRTVETHRLNLMHKLGVHSRAELLDYARKHNLT